jgi:retron-type reverse transcriptase
MPDTVGLDHHKPTSLRGIANKARVDKRHRFRDLYRCLDADLLRDCWGALNKDAASGVDGVTAEAYAADLQGNIEALAQRLKTKRYRAKLVRRCYIPKEKGSERPLGIPALKDKLVQLVAISQQAVWEAYKRGKANQGVAGVDEDSIAAFAKRLKDNLSKLWHRLSAGSSFPPPVKGGTIAKKEGGQRQLGVPTGADRIAQSVATLTLEPLVEPYFHADAYGYRPGKSAHQAIAGTRQRCWR